MSNFETESQLLLTGEKIIGTGFGFLTFESEESVERCCSEHYVNINGKQVQNPKQTKPTIAPTTPSSRHLPLALSLTTRFTISTICFFCL